MCACVLGLEGFWGSGGEQGWDTCVCVSKEEVPMEEFRKREGGGSGA